MGEVTASTKWRFRLVHPPTFQRSLWKTPVEVKCLVSSDLLSLCVRMVCFSLQQDVAISPKQRDEVIQWLAKLKYQFHLYPETLALAISLLDRFLAAVKVNICRYINWNRFIPPTQLFLCSVLLVWLYGNAHFPLCPHTLFPSDTCRIVPALLQKLNFGFWNWQHMIPPGAFRERFFP